MPYVCTGNKGSLYSQFHEGVPGTPSLHDAKSAYDAIAAAHEQDQDELRTALSRISVTYTGTASAEMQSAFQPLIDSLGVGVQKANSAAAAAQQQAGHFTVAQGKIRNEVPVPPEPWYEPIDPWNTSYDDAKAENSAIDVVNQAAFSEYGNNTNGNHVPTFQESGNQPTVNTAVTLDNSQQLNPGTPSSSAPGAHSSGRYEARHSSYAAPSAGGGGYGSALDPPAGAHPSSGSPGGSTQRVAPQPLGGNGSTTAQSFPTVGQNPPDSPSYTTPAPSGTGTPVGDLPGGSSGSGDFGPVGSFGSTGGFGPTGGGSESGTWGGSNGYGSASGGSAGHAGRGGSGAKSGVGSDAGPVAAGEESIASPGRPGAAGASGMGGLGRGRKDEDREHKSASYLVNEANGGEIVGDLPPTAPPTIGA